MVADCRTIGSVASSDYDLVIGPIADDKVWRHTNEFISKTITLEEFLEKAKVYQDFKQYCFLTKDSLKLLTRIN